MTQTTEDTFINVYSVGMCFASVCASRDVPQEDIERHVNASHPTGLDHGWHIAPEPFASGEKNPHDQPCGRHWLLVC